MVTVHHSQTQQKSEFRLVDFGDLCLECLTIVEERRRVGMTTIEKKLKIISNKILACFKLISILQIISVFVQRLADFSFNKMLQF